MAYHTRQQVQQQLRLGEPATGSREDELLDAQVGGFIEAYFWYEGPALARTRNSEESEFEVTVSGYFEFDKLDPGIRREGFSEFSERIEVLTFCATPDSKLNRADGKDVNPDDFYTNGSMILTPAKRLAVHIDDVLVSDQDAENLAEDLGVQAMALPAKMDPRERDNLIKFIGVLLHLHLDEHPGRYSKGVAGQLNVEKLATGIQDQMDQLGIEDTGLKLRSLKDKITTALALIEDLQQGRIPH